MQEVELVYRGNQKAAITEVDTNTCVSAGAGTGKTFVLVNRYIQLLKLGKATIQEIAAITFTEKAAREMKDRIRDFCSHHMNEHRKNLENAKIGTIHSFCARILRENSIIAGIDPRFRILDEAESVSLTTRLIHKETLDLIDKHDPFATHIISEYGFKHTIGILKELVKVRMDIERCIEQYMSMKDAELMEYWQCVDLRKKEELIRRITEDSEWKRAVELVSSYSAFSSDTLEEKRKKIQDILGIDTQEVNEKARIFIEVYKNSAKTGYKKTKWDPTALKAVLCGFSLLKEILKPNIKYLEATDEELKLKCIKITRSIFEIYRKIINRYDEKKTCEGLLDFNDLIIRTKKLLRENKHVRRIYQNQIRYLLVDEYQDIDSHQKEIILFLSEEPGLPQKDNAGDIVIARDKLFIVGDQKQSIYRFRGADVSVFAETKRILEKSGLCIDLDVNLRSNSQNIAFYNDFFGRIMGSRRLGKKDYEAVYTDLSPIRNVLTETAQLEFILVMEEGLNAKEKRLTEAEFIARRIRLMVENGEKLVFEKLDDNKPEIPRAVQYTDIAVMFRAMTNVEIYEKAFRKYNIPYYIISGSGFFARQEVKDILNFLKVLENPRDNIAMSGVLRSPLVGLDDDGLYLLRHKKDIGTEDKGNGKVPDLLDAVKESRDDPMLVSFYNTLVELAAVKDRIKIADLIEEIVRRTNYYSVLIPQFMGVQRVSNIKKIINSARKFEEKGIFGLSDFISYMKDFVANESREGEAPIVEEESNSVKLMTIHKAKGLEFPVVIVPDISKLPYTGGRDHFIYDNEFIGIGLKVKNDDGELEDTIQHKWIRHEEGLKELAESKRLLYVASTRAKDYLIYSGRMTNEGSKITNKAIWLNWFMSHYNINCAENSVINLTDNVKARITIDIPEVAEQKKPKPLSEQYSMDIRGCREIPYTEAGICPYEASVPAVMEQIKPITGLYALKDRFTATEFSEYIKCPKKYEFSHIMGIPELQKEAMGMEKALAIGNTAHKFFEKWNLDEKEIPALISLLADKSSVARLERFIYNFKKSPVYRELKDADTIMSEVTITFMHNGRIIEGVIDKLYKTKTGWTILDYKTDNIRRDEIEKRIESYEVQLGIYALGINKIIGVNPERLIIFFLEPGVPYSITCGDEYTQKMENRINSLILDIEKAEFSLPSHKEPERCNCDFKQICRLKEIRGSGNWDLRIGELGD